MSIIASDLNQYRQENFLKPYMKSGLNVYTKQRKQPISKVSFGSSTGYVTINPFNGWITNMTLRIELEALWQSDDCDAKTEYGYLNWVDSIGHALIESIELKIGNNVIYNSKFPYGLWLDIYNELNDPNMKEWSLIGKNASFDSLKIYEDNKKILYVPLHLWFSKNLESAFPYFKFYQNNNNTSRLQLKINIRDLNKLFLTNSNISEYPIKDRTIDIDIIYDTIESLEVESTTELYNIKKSILESNYYNYIEKIEYDTRPLNKNTSIQFGIQSAPLKNLILVNQNNDRNTQSTTYLINESTSDTNGNDWFNYGNATSIVNLNTNDTFEKLKILYKGKALNPSNELFDSIYYRKHTNNFFNKNVPRKHIYTVPFNITEYTKENILNGYFNYQGENKFQLNFTNIAENSTLSIFTVSINKLIINNDGSVLINEWNSGFIENSKYNNSLTKIESRLNNNLNKSFTKIESKINKLERNKLERENELILRLKINIIKFKLNYEYLGKNESYFIKKIINKNIAYRTYKFSNIISHHISLIKKNASIIIKENKYFNNYEQKYSFIINLGKKIKYKRQIQKVLKNIENEYDNFLDKKKLLSESDIVDDQNIYNTEIVNIKTKIQNIISSNINLLENINLNIKVDFIDIFNPLLNYISNYDIDNLSDTKPTKKYLITHIEYTNICDKPKIIFHSLNLDEINTQNKIENN